LQEKGVGEERGGTGKEKEGGIGKGKEGGNRERKSL
jgi:hypothetical protein